MFAQRVKSELQRIHWYAKVASVLQLPFVVLSVFPTPGDPLTIGPTVETGGPVSPLAVAAPSAATIPTRATCATSARPATTVSPSVSRDRSDAESSRELGHTPRHGHES